MCLTEGRAVVRGGEFRIIVTGQCACECSYQALRERIDGDHSVTPQTVRGLSNYVHGHIRRYGDYELEVEDVPPPISEEALTMLFARISERAAPVAGEEAVLEAL